MSTGRTELRVSVPRVSVVMCTYCGTKYLEKQLRSIAEQTLQPMELIVCDDASHDGTVALLERFHEEAPFPVHVVVNSRNMGSTRNFDQALGRASGDYVALADQDDLWLPTKLEVMVRRLEANPDMGGAFSDAYLMDDEDRVIGTKTLWELHRFGRRKQDAFANGGAIRLLTQHDIVTGSTVMVRGNLLTACRPIPSSWLHDEWIAWMLSLKAGLMPISEPLMKYRIHSEQQVGVGTGSGLRRLWTATAGERERERYVQVANQFEELNRHVLSDYPDRLEVIDLIRSKIDFLRRRARLPKSHVARLAAIWTSTPKYWRYARGFRSVCKDMTLG
jgi:glycosyltransferase involved in cell wall biosynthesis